MDFVSIRMYAGPTNVRWASEPNAIVQYFSIVGGVGITVTAVVAADRVLLTSGCKWRISDSQQIGFTDKNKAFIFTKNVKLNLVIVVVYLSWKLARCHKLSVEMNITIGLKSTSSDSRT